MTHILYFGAGEGQAAPLLLALHHSGHTLTLAHDPMALSALSSQTPGTIVALSPTVALEAISIGLATRGWPWLGWNTTDDPALALQAYQAGASAVLPATVTPEVILQTLRTSSVPAPQPITTRQLHYHRGDVILPDTDTVIEVQTGVVALSAIHPDGAQVLLGLCGPGQTLVGHPHDTCSLHLVAHTDAAVTFRVWAEAARAPDFSERLRARLGHLEAWAAMQARPHLDQRLLGLLSLLAEQFGEPRPQGTLINVRFTHTQLASAVGATRTTITRTLGDLRARGRLTTIGAGEAERFCLPELEPGHHHTWA